MSTRRRQGQNRRGRGRPQKSVDLWRPAPELPEFEPITPVEDATALVRSLGEPPLYRHGEAAEQPSIVTGVGLVRQPRSQVEGAEEVALAYQWHDELDSGSANGVEGVGDQLEVADRYRRAGGDEHRLQRIARRDRDRVEHVGRRLRPPGHGLLPLLGPAPSQLLQHRHEFYSPSVPVALRTHTPTEAGCIVSETTPTQPSTTSAPSA